MSLIFARKEGTKIFLIGDTRLTYWAQVNQVVAPDDFETDRDDIRFFKYIKPRFTGQLHF